MRMKSPFWMEIFGFLGTVFLFCFLPLTLLIKGVSPLPSKFFEEFFCFVAFF